MQTFASITENYRSAGTKPARSPLDPVGEIHQPVSTLAPLTIHRKAGCSCGGGCPSCQSSAGDLRISQPNDTAEIEADLVADRVMQTPVTVSEKLAPTTTSSGHSTISAKTAGSTSVTVAKSIADRIQSSGTGAPLAPTAQRFFESRFGTNLDNVAVHAGPEAARLNRELSAQAFTVGNNIFFGTDQYQPDTDPGRRLIAHELTHTFQQSGTLSIQRQTPPDYVGESGGNSATQTAGVRDDKVVQALIDDALVRKGSVEAAFRDLQSRRCVLENCGDENLAAAEHYMFARHCVQDGVIPSEIKALFMTGLIGIYAVLKLIGVVPSVCPEICPVTPTSLFQVKWEMRGVQDGMIVDMTPAPPVGVPDGTNESTPYWYM